jgi:hypothetical protein
MKYCFWLMGVTPSFNSTIIGAHFGPDLGLSSAHTPGILKGSSGIHPEGTLNAQVYAQAQFPEENSHWDPNNS